MDKKYIKFIKNNKYITELQKEQLLKLNKLNKNNFGINNIDYKYLIYDTFILANNKYYNNYRLQTLFYEIFKEKTAIKIFEYMAHLINTNKRLSNTEIMYKINYFKLNTKNKNKIITKPYEDKWDFIIQKIGLRLKNYTFNSNNILDYGCGSGKKSSIIKKEFKVDDKDMYYADINSWGPYNNNKFSLIQNNKTTFSDNMFKIVFCINVLHHCSSLKETISELYRILEPDGILVVVEHDCYTEFDVKLINLQHLFYSIYYDRNNTDLNIPPNYTYLFNAFEMDYLFKPFVFDHASTIFSSVDLKIVNYDNSLFAFYKKI